MTTSILKSLLTLDPLYIFQQKIIYQERILISISYLEYVILLCLNGDR